MVLCHRDDQCGKWLAVLLPLWLLCWAWSGAAWALTESEAAWLREHPRVRVGTGSEWAPYDFEDKAQWTGLSRDYLQAVAKDLGLNLEFVPSTTWNQAKERLLSGEIDLLPAVYHDPDLAARCYFTDPYFNVKEYLFVREDEHPQNLESLKGRRVAFVRGSDSETVVRRQYPDIVIVSVDTIREALDKVVTRQADGYIDALGAVTFVIREQGLAGVNVAFPVELVDTRLRMACGRGNEQLCTMLDRALHGISHVRRQEIEQRWVLLPDKARQIPLTAEERAWMARFGPVRVGGTPEWAPVTYFDSAGTYQGMLADYVRLIGERTGLEFQARPSPSRAQALLDVQHGNVDMIDLVRVTPVLRERLDPLQLGIAMENVIVTREANRHLHSLEQCGGLKVGVVESYGIAEAMRTDFPAVTVMPCANTEAGLTQLLRGGIDALVTDMATLDYVSATANISNVRVSGVTPYALALHFGVRKDVPELASILRKGLESISEVERKEIFRRWITIEYERMVDYSLLWKVLTVAALILGGTLYWNRRLQHEIGVRIRTEQQLRLVHEELTKAKELAESATRAKSEFLANMSHEIRTPMNSVLGFAELLAGRVTDPVQKDYLASIRIGGNALLRIINDILDLSKIEAGQLQLTREAVEVRSVVHELRALFHDKIRQKDLELELIVAQDVPEFVLLDGGRVRQVLFNLVGNAIKFTEHGGVTVRVRAEESAADRVTLSIEVEDTGIGIDTANLTHIFDAFAQQPGQDRRYGGTGLGLSICTKLVGLMDGDIAVRSERGRGSVFTVTLHGVLIAAGAAVVAPAENPDAISFLPGTVLVVDDVDDNRKLIRGMFESTQLQVREAANGREALDMLRTESFDLVLLDLHMPELSGYELMALMLEDQRLAGIPVIAVTASVLVEDMDRVERHGFAGALRKPLSRSELFAMTAQHLPYAEAASRLHGDAVADPCHASADAENELAGPMHSRWEQIRDQGDIGLVERFAADLEQVAARYDLPPLAHYARELTQACASFNIARVLQLMNDYPDMIGVCPGGDVEHTHEAL